MFGSKMYLYKRRQTVQLLDGIRDNVKGNLPEDLIYRERTSSASRHLLYTHSDLPSEGDWKGEGRGREKNCHFLALSPPNPPYSFQEWPLSLSLSTKIQEETSSHPAEGIWEKRLYRVLILWLFLQFLNFKWEYWNTDIDMKRFIVTIYHYCHRPCCYYSFRGFLVSAFGGWNGAHVQSVYFLTV